MSLTMGRDLGSATETQAARNGRYSMRWDTSRFSESGWSSGAYRVTICCRLRCGGYCWASAFPALERPVRRRTRALMRDGWALSSFSTLEAASVGGSDGVIVWVGMLMGVSCSNITPKGRAWKGYIGKLKENGDFRRTLRDSGCTRRDELPQGVCITHLTPSPLLPHPVPPGPASCRPCFW